MAPDGTSLLVSYALLNLTHGESHAAPAPLEPGETYRVRIELNDIAHAFQEGHRVRIAISTSYWPMAWPSPAPVVLTVVSGSSALHLPVRPPSAQDEALRPFEPALAAPEGSAKPVRRLPFRRMLEVDLATNQTVLTLVSGEFDAALAKVEQIEMDLGYTVQRRFRISAGEPLSAQAEIVQRSTMRRGDWAIWMEIRTRLSATRDAFQFCADLEAYERDQLFGRRSWQISIPRHLV